MGVVGVEERFLSAEIALLEETVLVALGEGHLLVLVGVDDLYLELTSIVLDRRVAEAATALFFSAGTRGGLVVSVRDCCCCFLIDAFLEP